MIFYLWINFNVDFLIDGNAFFWLGFCDKCVLGNIEIGTTRSGIERAGKPEWNVVVMNNCKCAQSLITVNCQGFQSSYPVDPTKLVKHGDKCIINRSDALAGGASIKFSYAWDPPFILVPVSSIVIPC